MDHRYQYNKPLKRSCIRSWSWKLQVCIPYCNAQIRTSSFNHFPPQLVVVDTVMTLYINKHMVGMTTLIINVADFNKTVASFYKIRQHHFWLINTDFVFLSLHKHNSWGLAYSLSRHILVFAAFLYILLPQLWLKSIFHSNYVSYILRVAYNVFLHDISHFG